MKRWLASGLLGMVVALVGGRAEDVFSKTIRREDFEAAELAKLSPEALKRLDALVQAFKSGAVTKGKAAEEGAEVEAKAVKAAAEGGFFAKAKVRLQPGTEVEYATVETRLMGEFRGWKVGTVFALENGQRWQVVSGDYYTPPEAGPRTVRISPGVLGSFFLEFEGVRQKPKVKFIGGGK